MAVSLRPYQSDFVNGIRSAFGRRRRVLGVAPTGSGKTVVFSYIGQAATARGSRVMIVAHRIEIVEQISLALDRFGVVHGRIMQGHAMTDDLTQVGMVQTVARRLDKLIEPSLLIIDEAHHGVAGTWEKLGTAWSRSRHLGMTATPERLDGRGLGGAFDEMIQGPSTAELIAAGYLARFTYLAPPQVADLSHVDVTRGGDFSAEQLSDILDRPTITGDACAHYQRHLGGKPAIVFCVSVAHAEHVAEQFRAAGIRAASVDGSMDRDERRRRIKAIGNGELQALTSCDIISEGTDIPVVGGAILLRPTQSVAMFLQQCGRCLRPKDDGSQAVILDHVGNVGRHGMPDDDRVWSLDAKRRKPANDDDEEVIRLCKICDRAFPRSPNDAAARLSAGCSRGATCPMQIVPDVMPSNKAMLAVKAGELQEVDRDRIARIRLTPIDALLTGRETYAELEEIRKLRGYKPGWSKHVMGERHRARVGA